MMNDDDDGLSTRLEFSRVLNEFGYNCTESFNNLFILVINVQFIVHNISNKGIIHNRALHWHELQHFLDIHDEDKKMC